MRRRQALSGIVASVVSFATARSLAQTAGPPFIVGLLDAGNQTEWWDGFRQQLRDLGYVEGRNVRFEARYAKGKLDELPRLAKELVDLKVSIIVTASTASAIAAGRATRTIPIVVASGGDQVSRGLVQSQARPGGNLTGVSSRSADLMGKRLDLLREVVPKGSAFGVLWHTDNVASMTSVRELDTVAGRAQVALQSHGIRDPGDLVTAFESMKRARIAGLIVIHAALIYAEREPIIGLARKHRLPALYGASEYADVGGLLAYGPSYPDLFRRAAVYVDKIAEGAKPGDLPIEQASVFELVVNARAARAIDIALPPAMLARATRVIG